ncbi:hypothetical protein D7Z54_07485 [Salibacterium salarium]|uniref:Phage capsid protein n=1 Tax=Salibacterium salarium TaxID=284579 RepID=A0A3R9P933_9BACI|nr:DUF6366 family protein [Salibacterium salarium]RSL34076.1 hypothetical protein D7Z54_07485 [Salibacterium salarium]
MKENEETPERRREKLKQEELKRNPTGNMKDAHHRASNGGLVDIVGSLGWKGTGILILAIIVGFMVASFFFR